MSSLYRPGRYQALVSFSVAPTAPFYDCSLTQLAEIDRRAKSRRSNSNLPALPLPKLLTPQGRASFPTLANWNRNDPRSSVLQTETSATNPHYIHRQHIPSGIMSSLSLLTTLRYAPRHPEPYPLLDYHVARLLHAWQHFASLAQPEPQQGLEQDVRRHIQFACEPLEKTKDWRVRWTIITFITSPMYLKYPMNRFASSSISPRLKSR